MARKRTVFSVLTLLGYRVSLTRDRWRAITQYKHPALEGQEGHVRECLEKPNLIHESTKDSEVHMHYAKRGRRYLCVVVAPAAADDLFVVTAYFTKKIKQGRTLWKS